MPRTPGILVSPNSAPDSLTPKYLNLVREAEQPDLSVAVDWGALVVGVVGLAVVGAVVGAVVVGLLEPGKHWE